MADSDLDNELLQVAGQGGRKKTPASKRKRTRATSDSDEDVSLDDESELEWEGEEEDEEEEYEAPAKRARSSRAKRAAALGDDEEDDDVAMGDDDLILDEDDRKKLEGMTELEREMLIAERAEQRQQELQRKKLLKQAGADAAAATKLDKKKASSTRLKSTREQKEEAAKKSAIEELKAARERKTKGGAARAAKPSPTASEEATGAGEGPSLDRDLSDFEEGEEYDDDVGYRTGYRTGYGIDEEDEEAREAADFEDIKGITVRRYKLEEWFSKPFFDATLPGIMVKVVLSEVKDMQGRLMMGPNGQPLKKYLLAQVIDVEERPPGYYKFKDNQPYKSPYPFGPDQGGANGGGKPRTNKWIRIARGHSEKLWPLAMVSNEGVTEDDYEKFQRQCEIDRKSPITRGEVSEIKDRLSKADTYTYTAEDVKRMLEEKKARGLAPVNLVAERAKLEQERTAAEEAGLEEKVEELALKIAALDAQQAVRTSQRRGQGPSMAELNRKNAELNVKQRENAGKGGAGGKEGAASTLDPFSRRATRSTIYWKTKQTQDTQEEDLTLADAVQLATVASLDAEALKKKEPISVDEVMDLSGLDLSVLDRGSGLNPLARKLLGAAGIGGGDGGYATRAVMPVNGGRVLSLEEYWSRRGGAPPPPPPPPMTAYDGSRG